MAVQTAGNHLDQLIRQTRAHHVALSAAADFKANMLLTLSAVVIPLTIRFLDTEKLRYAAIVLIGACAVTAALAAYSAMPKILNDKNPAPKSGPNFNPLFFGDFARLNYEEFTKQLEDAMQSPAAAYEVQLREIYTMGMYLANRKYKYLKLAYMSMIAGIILSVFIWLGTEGLSILGVLKFQ